MEKVIRLKKLLGFHKLDGYIIPKNDEYFSEYIEKNKDSLQYISNFSGSYGFAIILKKQNYLFVDGRYTIQAQKQSGKNFKIITIPKKNPKDVFGKRKLIIGFDPKIHTRRNLQILFKKTNCKLVSIHNNLIDRIWIRKKNQRVNKFYALPKTAVDQNYNSKINSLIKILYKKKADFQFISSGENVAWLLNIRGKDTAYAPIPNAYLLIDTNKNIFCFCNLKKIQNSIKKNYKNIRFISMKYVDIFLSKIHNKNILIDANTCSIHFEDILAKKNKLVGFIDPINFLKSIKSKKEINNTIKSHIYDGVALTKFLFWIKKNYKKNINELSAQEKLLKFRKKNKNFKFSSFPTISGSGPNGAIIHYKATTKSNRKLTNGDIYLVDSGGQYNFGTTDVTRTISLNNNNKKVKEIFTRVLKGHIAVANFKLKTNTCGKHIDIVARKYLKEINLDYPHGTGHGVGYFLNVHEGPQSISKNNKVPLKEGMILSNEPGYYKKDKFGIRIENLIRVKKNKKKLIFDNLTLVPIDKSLIDINYLEKNEINWLNNYHYYVFKKLKQFMNKSEFDDLKTACSKI